MKKALVIDDSKIARMLISHLLIRFGISSVEATNGLEALKVLKDNNDVEIIFIDWNMPVMSGIEFLSKVKALPNYKSVKTVMVTTNNEMEFILSALGLGVDEYIMHPLTREIFEEKLALLGLFPVESLK